MNMLFFKGIGALILTLAVFTLFSVKCPLGEKAMGGLAGAAIATFLVEAICKYILGDFAGLPFFTAVGTSAGSLGGPAAAILVGLAMGTQPVFAVSSGMALSGMSILPGFMAGYLLHFLLRIVRRLPEGVDMIFGALAAAAAGYGIARAVDPGVSAVIGTVGDALLAATAQSPLLMGLLLGGVIKIICTSPLSSMALTAMLALTGQPMGIAAIACFGGSFTNGIVFWRLRLGSGGKIAAVMLEPLTQADVITRNPLPIYCSNFFGGGLSGMCAAALGIVCDAPGTASPIPGMLAPFAFNPPGRVLLALALSAVCGAVSGLVGAEVFLRLAARGHTFYHEMRPPRP
jgi:fructose-specific phosphotransferase system IIC component